MNPTAVKDYLDTVEELFTTHNPPDENILQKDGERKITTVIETIAGNGTTLRPTVIILTEFE